MVTMLCRLCLLENESLLCSAGCAYWKMNGYCAMQVVSTAEAVWWPQSARVLLPTARREKEENPEAVLKRKD